MKNKAPKTTVASNSNVGNKTIVTRANIKAVQNQVQRKLLLVLDFIPLTAL